MDEVDSIIGNAAAISNTKISATGSSSGSPLKILKLLKDAIADGKDLSPTVPMLGKAIEYLEDETAKTENADTSQINELADKIQNSANTIMMSLQIQDIASQQLASVDHLLKNLQKRLQTLLYRFNDDDMGELSADKSTKDNTNVTQMHRDIAFDSDAVNRYEDNDTQSDIDAMFESGLTDDMLNESQDDNEETAEDLNKDGNPKEEAKTDGEDNISDDDLAALGITDFQDEDNKENDISDYSSIDTETAEASESNSIETDISSSVTADTSDDNEEINQNANVESHIDMQEEEQADQSETESQDNLEDGDTQFSQDDIDALFGS
jgi:hypothetical protein